MGVRFEERRGGWISVSRMGEKEKFTSEGKGRPLASEEVGKEGRGRYRRGEEREF